MIVYKAGGGVKCVVVEKGRGPPRWFGEGRKEEVVGAVSGAASRSPTVCYEVEDVNRNRRAAYQVRGEVRVFGRTPQALSVGPELYMPPTLAFPDAIDRCNANPKLPC